MDKTEAWLCMPLALLWEQGLTKSGALVCATIIDYATKQADAYEWMHIPVKKLMQDTGCSRMTIYNALSVIERLGLIEIRHAGSSGNTSGSAFRLTGSVELCPADCTSEDYTTEQSEPATANTQTRNHSELTQDEIDELNE